MSTFSSLPQGWQPLGGGEGASPKSKAHYPVGIPAPPPHPTPVSLLPTFAHQIPSGKNHQTQPPKLQSAIQAGRYDGFFHFPSLSSYFPTFFLGILSSVLKNDPCMSQSQGGGVGVQRCSGRCRQEVLPWAWILGECALDSKQPPSAGGSQLQPREAPSRGGRATEE